jgi:hypothetical protein
MAIYVDVTGSVITLTRESPEVSAIVSDRVGNDDEARNFVAPFVLIRHQTTSRSPGDGRRATGRISKQVGRYAALCYGRNRVEAEHLTRVVSELWHEAGIQTGTNGALIRQSWADILLGATNAPGELRKPYATVYIDVLAEAAPYGV